MLLINKKGTMTANENMKYLMQRLAPNSNFGGPFFKRLSLIQDYTHQNYMLKHQINQKLLKIYKNEEVNKQIIKDSVKYINVAIKAWI